MTINKSQGQSLKNVGLYLPKQVFRHGQLYVALSRVTNKNGLKVLTFEDDYPEGNVAKKILFTRRSFNSKVHFSIYIVLKVCTESYT
jgi:ATP-dependent DNA helicase PIF1